MDLKNKLIVLLDFTLTPEEAQLTFYNEKGEKSFAAITSAKKDFTEDLKQYLIEVLVIYLVVELSVVTEKIQVSLPVTPFLKYNIKTLSSRLFSWISHFNQADCIAEIVFDSEVAPSKNLSYTPNNKTAIIGWSRGKESIASYEIAKEAGYKVIKATFNKPVDQNADAIYSLRTEGLLYKDPTLIYPFFKKGYFDYQGYICLPLLGMLVLQGRSHKVDTLLIGSEYGTSHEWEFKEQNPFLDLAADESYEAAEFTQEWLKSSFGINVAVSSPVATLTEVAIINYILKKGYKYSKLESCWNYSMLRGTNCEACLKCNRLKIYGKYLVDRGNLDPQDLKDSFITKDYPDIASAVLTTYSMGSKRFILDIVNNDTKVDWSTVYTPYPRDILFTGEDFMQVVKAHFTETSISNSWVEIPDIEVYEETKVVKECISYLGEDYRADIENKTPLIALTDFALPFEDEVFKEHLPYMPYRVLSYFSKWVLYNGENPCGVVTIKGLDIPDLHKDPSRNPIYYTESPIIKKWMQKKNILSALKAANIKFNFA